MLGYRDRIQKLVEEHGLDIEGCTIIDPREEDEREEKYAKAFHAKRQRKGTTLKDATG